MTSIHYMDINLAGCLKRLPTGLTNMTINKSLQTKKV